MDTTTPPPPAPKELTPKLAVQVLARLGRPVTPDEMQIVSLFKGDSVTPPKRVYRTSVDHYPVMNKYRGFCKPGK